MNGTEFFISWIFVLLHFNKNCKQPNFKCVLLTTWSLILEKNQSSIDQ